MTIKNLVILSFLFLFFAPLNASAPRITLQQYIETWSGVAKEEMRLHGIPASIKLAQGILESGFGNSRLARYANNHFGIKCHGWSGRSIRHDDDKPNECFRAYDSAMDSFRDHSQFLLSRPWYAPLFELDIMDFRGWARGLQRAGYATNPRYAEKLIRIIEENNLYRFDIMALEPAAQPVPAMDTPETTIIEKTKEPIVAEQTSATTQNLQATPVREVRSNNRIRYIIAFEGDTPENIAREMEMRTWQIIRYNELGDGRTITPGQIIYLQPKRRKGVQAYHIVQQGETLYDISQIHGVQMRFLMKRNHLESSNDIEVGQRLLLRGRMQN